MRIRLGAKCLVVLLLVSASAAQSPLGTAFTYQGRLESAGSAASGPHDLRFRLHDASAGGAQVGATLCANNVSVTDGLFTVSLDFGAPFAGQERFLEIDVRADTGLDCTNATGFAILAPRQALTAAPNALFAVNANLLNGLNSTAFLQSIPVPLTVTGTSAATHIIRGENTSTVSGSSGVHGESSSVGGLGVIGIATSTSPFQPSFGGLFEGSGPLGRGVRGEATSLTGTAHGGHFISNSSEGRGVFGEARSTTGNTYGGFFENESSLGRAVYGKATALSGSNYGGHFDSDSTSGTGVFGNVTASSGTNYGGIFRSSSPNGFGALSVNLALGSASDVELSGPNGAINTPGFLYREYTASTRSAAIPIAYGSISAAGAINGGTGNFTVSHNVTGEYDITISGETYSNSTFAVSITPLQNSIPMCGTAADVGAAFRINIWRLDTAVKADVAFQFVVYATNPSEPG